MAKFRVSIACGVPNSEGGILGEIYEDIDPTLLLVPVMSRLGAYLPALHEHICGGIPCVLRIEVIKPEIPEVTS
jgi:hypothetical protein